MENLFLEDLKWCSEEEVKTYIAEEYAGTESRPTADDTLKVAKVLEDFDVLVAYESVGSWGCDSSSWFLLRSKEDGKLWEFSGSHCSCFGFEGQFDLQETSLEYLKSDKFYFCSGGYDAHKTKNQKAVKEFLLAL